MTQTGRTQNGFSTAGNSLRSLSPKTVAAICLMALMGVLALASISEIGGVLRDIAQAIRAQG